MKVSLVSKEDVPAHREFERKSRFKKIFTEMAESGKILVIEEDSETELAKFQRTLHTMSKRYIPSDLKVQTRKTEPTVMIARLTEKKYKPKTLGELLYQNTVKVVADLRSLGVIKSDMSRTVDDYLSSDDRAT